MPLLALELLFAAVAIGWAVRELLWLRRDREARRRASDAAATPADPPPPPPA